MLSFQNLWSLERTFLSLCQKVTFQHPSGHSPNWPPYPCHMWMCGCECEEEAHTCRTGCLFTTGLSVTKVVIHLLCYQGSTCRALDSSCQYLYVWVYLDCLHIIWRYPDYSLNGFDLSCLFKYFTMEFSWLFHGLNSFSYEVSHMGIIDFHLSSVLDRFLRWSFHKLRFSSHWITHSLIPSLDFLVFMNIYLPLFIQICVLIFRSKSRLHSGWRRFIDLTSHDKGEAHWSCSHWILSTVFL